ncbi:MAG: DUF3039 domain-containing protein [Actinocrinis sp.]
MSTAADTLSGGTATITEERVEVSTDHGDHERFSHYAEKEKITEAMVLGTPVTALCGKVWVPSRDPSRFPICPTCKEIYEDPEFFHEDEDASEGAK